MLMLHVLSLLVLLAAIATCSCHWMLPTPLPTPTRNHTANVLSDHAQTAAHPQRKHIT
ncbi:hypothetical protein COEREDRAFT_83472 [Coemansia reversa NRRL 1564]|uniref:Protein kish n=1 Tax=Coemansia reversa (strain ATCC 12441 / NRRL 1564) TaxID=763665 RepID=A0A2G5B356_COERN|nr:hypothetical protein COEREDRAFT_83472 [Coemansia reversa NRRL 1564]|eukprot:PIA13452.1 hypothetical protein COEREDRAFT_83472 [Coemansia reversa NRRL 1564]